MTLQVGGLGVSLMPKHARVRAMPDFGLWALEDCEITRETVEAVLATALAEKSECECPWYTGEAQEEGL